MSQRRLVAQQTRFLTVYAQYGRISEAARRAKVNREYHYRWLRQDPTYAARFQEADELATQQLEDEAFRRAHDGVRQIQLYKGRPVRVEGKLVYVTEFSDQLIMFLLRGRRPEKYKERHELEVWDGDIEKLTPAQNAKLAEAILLRLANGDPDRAAELRQQALLEAGETVDVTAEEP